MSSTVKTITRFARLLILTVMAVVFAAHNSVALPLTISIDASKSLRADPVVSQAIDDVDGLLRSSFPGAVITRDARSCRVRIVLPDVSANRDRCVPGPSARPCLCTAVPDAAYRWRSNKRGKTITVSLSAVSPEGVAAGLYGLLQEKLGFRFYHPRESMRLWGQTYTLDKVKCVGLTP